MPTQPKRFKKGIVLKNISDGPNPSDTNPTCNIPGHAWVIDTATTEAPCLTSSACTVVVACNKFVLACHGLANGERVKLSTSCTVPTGLTACAKYYVVGVCGSDYQVSLTSGGAAIALTGTGTGTQTFTVIEQQIQVYLCAGAEKVVTDSNKITLSNKTHTSPVLNGCLSGTAFLDCDCLTANSATKVASQQSIKAYVDAQVTAQDLDTAGDSGTGCVDLDSQSLTVSGAAGVSTVAACQAITITVDHDAICNFVADEHVAHSGVSITAGTGLSGGGAICTTRTLNVCIACETAVCGAVAGTDEILINDITACACAGAIKKITAANLSPGIAHDCTSGFVADEHVAHSGVCVIAGAGMTGGGAICASRTLNVIAGNGITVNANDVAVNADNGITVGACGVSVNADNGITVGACGVSVNADTGISVGACGVAIDCTVATLTGCQTFTCKTLTAPVINTSILLDATVACPTCCNVAGELRFEERTGACSNYVGFKAPDSIAANIMWTLPAADGCACQTLSTNGCGVLSWICGGGVAGPACSTDNAIVRWNSTCGGVVQDSGVTISDCCDLSMPSGGQIITDNGTGCAPGLAIGLCQTTKTGITRASNNMQIVAHGNEQLNITSTYNGWRNPFRITVAGSTSAPSIMKAADTNSGLSLPGCDVVHILTGGAARLTATNCGVNVLGALTVNCIAVGGGAGGLSLFDDYEADTCTNIVTYDDGACGPCDLTGGCVITVTKGLETCAPLANSCNSYKLSKSAADLKGEGWAITTDRVPRIASTGGKTVNVTFYYETSACYVSGDVNMYAYRVGSNTLEALNMANGSTVSNDLPAAPCGGEFSAPITLSACDTSVRIGWNVATTSALAYDVVVDAVDVSVANKISAPIMTDWESFTPTGSWVCNTSYSGHKRRVGCELEVIVLVETSCAPNSTNLRIDIPCCLVIDSTKLTPDGGAKEVIGQSTVVQQGIGTYSGMVAYNDDCCYTQVRPFYYADFCTTYEQGTTITQAAPFTWGNLDGVWMRFTVPICGWSSGNIMSTNELNQQTLKVRATSNTAQCIGSGTSEIVIFEDLVEDTHNAYNVCTGVFTAPSDGTAFVATGIRYSGACITNGFEYGLRIHKNCVRYRDIDTHEIEQTASTVIGMSGSALVDVLKGDTIEIAAFQNTGACKATSTETTGNFLDITFIPDFSTIGVNGVNEYKEIIYACNTSSTCANTFVDATGTLSLGPGTWDLGYDVGIAVKNVCAGATNRGQVVVRDGCSNVIVGTESLLGSTSLNASEQIHQQASKTVQVTITATTSYKMSVKNENAAATGTTLIVGTGGFSAGISENENASKLWARRAK